MRFARSLAAAVGAAVLLASPGRDAVLVGQTPDAVLLQLEVTDSVGLPLPNARLELFTYMDRAVFREWVPVAPSMLGEGIHLLRFSHEGYRPTVFSVPLRKGAPVTLRVRLHPDSGARGAIDAIEATGVHAIGTARDGRDRTDIIGDRVVLDRDDIDRAGEAPIAEILRRARGTQLFVMPQVTGPSSVGARPGTGRWMCEEPVILNGDPTLTLRFGRYEELYRRSEPEAIEIVPKGRAMPYRFRRSDGDCIMLLIWHRGR